MYNRYYPYQYNRSKEQISSSNQMILPRGCPSSKKNFDLKSLKKNTCSSLNDVECFLNNFSHTLKYIRLINLLK